MEETYVYFSRRRLDINTFPTEHDNPPLSIQPYDQLQPGERGGPQAWGKIVYAKPLTKEQVEEYELRPSYNNPDERRAIETLAKAVGAWEEKNRVPEDMRLTIRFGETYSMLPGVDKHELEHRHSFSLEHPTVKIPPRKYRREPGRSR